MAVLNPLTALTDPTGQKLADLEARLAKLEMFVKIVGNDVTMKTSGVITLDAGSNLTIKGNATVTVDASAGLTMKGASVTGNASGPMVLRGATIALN